MVVFCIETELDQKVTSLNGFISEMMLAKGLRF